MLEIGTLGGYSTIWLARALPAGGKVAPLELSPEAAAIAASNVARAGVADLVDIMVRPALESLQRLKDEAGAKFDLVFIDADKPNNPHYLRAALDLVRPGALIVGDNGVRDGAVVDPASSDDRVQRVRAFTDLLAETDGLFSTAIQPLDRRDGMA